MVWRFLKELGIKPPYDPTIPLLGIYPEETKTEKDTYTPIFIAEIQTLKRNNINEFLIMFTEHHCALYL